MLSFDWMYVVWVIQNLSESWSEYAQKQWLYIKYLAHKDYFPKLVVKSRSSKEYTVLYNNDTFYHTVKNIVERYILGIQPCMIKVENVNFLTCTYPDGFVSKYYDVDEESNTVHDVYVYGKDGLFRVSNYQARHSAYHHMDAPKALVFMIDTNIPSDSYDLSEAYNKLGVVLAAFKDVHVSEFKQLTELVFDRHDIGAVEDYSVTLLKTNEGINVLDPKTILP